MSDSQDYPGHPVEALSAFSSMIPRASRPRCFVPEDQACCRHAVDLESSLIDASVALVDFIVVTLAHQSGCAVCTN